ncbi:hypothetical protein OH492_10225 [Vibrio chagasii]|nr:hypothetical protein [Vibrio chagasii]
MTPELSITYDSGYGNGLVGSIGRRLSDTLYTATQTVLIWPAHYETRCSHPDVYVNHQGQELVYIVVTMNIEPN